ncbi:putative disease resistance protein RGA3 isoform X1 [Dendrobium catenatum]|uniref:putative disease resistance protein RGA3 isoform X1 n=2 Tax=Dendrobium catenatum TaxID=906689 RepID=UPI0010A07353|nr:putative disease resistance protein RGA3 isoform X1 [Dendrobium catenatum]
MAMILSAFVDSCVDKLIGLVTEKVVIVLGVKDELRRLQRRMMRIQKFLEAAERRRLEDPYINHWVCELKDVVYDADDIIDRCRIQGALLLVNQPSSAKKTWVCFNLSLLSSCFTNVPHRYQIGESIRSLNDKLEEIYKDRLQFNLEDSAIQKSQMIMVVNTRQSSSLDEFDVVGREIEEATKGLVALIVQEQRKKCRVIAVTGMGGIGKTTLAQKIYNNKKIQTEFQIKVWVCVSQSYNEIELLQQVIRGAGAYYGEAITRTELQPLLKSAVHGKSLFLVLDDVWRADVWINLFRNPLQSADAIVRILVTTRDENVAREMGVAHIHPVKQLSIQTSWEMLCRKVFEEGQENEIGKLEDLGIQIVGKCSGLPLAIKAIAGVLAKKGANRKEWDKVLKNDAWSMSNLPEELRGALYLSYDDLPAPLKQCFLYCSLFPEDELIERDDLVRLWVAEGFVKEMRDSLVEDVAEEYYIELIRRNLLQPDPHFFNAGACTMHDLIRSLAKFLSHDEIFSGNTMASSSRTKLRRLSIDNEENITDIMGLITEQKCLRTLLTYNGIRLLNDNQLVGLACLRVLQINDVDIESIPTSIGNLIHLRYLNLDDTNIKELPESIGSLTNLQFLNLRGCLYLTTLPKAITKLQNLRRLGLYSTPLIFIPKGISKLENINDLSGFVVANPGEPVDSCSGLEELNFLYQLRKLRILKTERAQKGVASLQKLTHLVYLMLFYTEAKDRPLPTQEEIKRIEDVFEELDPPRCLERLYISHFFGSRYPSWMMSPSFGERLPLLTTLNLTDNISCTKLPAAGELPQLSQLDIKGSASVKIIGPEFLGVGVDVRDGMHTLTRTAFPNLQNFALRHMPELEEWTFSKIAEEFEQGRGKARDFPKIILLPRLDELKLIDCPKLKALPKGLEHSNMKQLHIDGAHLIRIVENFINLKEELRIINNQRLERVSHLPALKVLIIHDCPALHCVEKLDSLEQLELHDFSIEGLPEWLPRLLQDRKKADDDDFHFEFMCNERALRRLLKGGTDWSLIKDIPRVFAYDNKQRGFLRYTKNPFNYYTNVEM